MGSLSSSNQRRRKSAEGDVVQALLSSILRGRATLKAVILLNLMEETMMTQTQNHLILILILKMMIFRTVSITTMEQEHQKRVIMGNITEVRRILMMQSKTCLSCKGLAQEVQRGRG